MATIRAKYWTSWTCTRVHFSQITRCPRRSTSLAQDINSNFDRTLICRKREETDKISNELFNNETHIEICSYRAYFLHFPIYTSRPLPLFSFSGYICFIKVRKVKYAIWTTRNLTPLLSYRGPFALYSRIVRQLLCLPSYPSSHWF